MEGSNVPGLDRDTGFDFNNLTNRIERGIIAGHVQSAVISLFFLIGLPCNALVIGIILKKKLFTRPSIMLLLNLATANFLACLLVMPFPVVLGILARSFTVEDFPAYNQICRSGVLFNLFQLVSIYTVAMISVDRVIYLKKPLTYEHIITPWRMFLVIVILWAAFIVISLLPLWGFGRVEYFAQLATCVVIAKDQMTPLSPSPTLFSYFALLIALDTLGALVHLAGSVWIIYITREHLMARVLRLMRLHSRTQNGGLVENDFFRNYKKSQLQLVKLCVAIFAVTLSTELPVVILAIALPITGLTPSIYPMIPIAYILSLSKTVLHPIMEANMTHKIRDVISVFCKSTFAKIKTKCISCRNNVDSTTSV